MFSLVIVAKTETLGHLDEGTLMVALLPCAVPLFVLENTFNPTSSTKIRRMWDNIVKFSKTP